MPPQKLPEIIDAVVASGARGLTSSEVHGFGRQYGIHFAREQDTRGAGAAGGAAPKARVDVVVPDETAEAIVTAIAKCTQTGSIGDGKIWVSPVDSALRVRTGARDNDAL